jgi:NAD(P)-dependent dehydrogenase (short-subunit alcohol dehydrogenase family)
MANAWAHIRYDYAGAQVLVTGGTSGIGLAIARAYREAGAEVTITGTRDSAAEYDDDLVGLHYRCLRMDNRKGIDALPKSLERLDILVNNAGAVWPGGWPEDEPEGFEASLQINLSAAFRLASACRPLLAHSQLPGGASVIGLASMASYFGIPVVPGYGAAKAGLVQLTKTLAMAWAREGIRVNAVAPGLTESRMTARHVADPDALGATLARTPLHRVGQPADVAGVVLFLTSGAAAYVTGQTLPVDGGYSIA